MSLSTDMTAGLMDENMSLHTLIVLTLEHDELLQPIRLVDAEEDIVSRGNTFVACGLGYTPPEEREEGYKRAKVRLNNVDQVLTPALRSLPSDITITMERLSASDLGADPKEYDTVEGGSIAFELQSADYDNRMVQINIAYENFSQRQFPPGTFSVTTHPGLHP